MERKCEVSLGRTLTQKSDRGFKPPSAIQQFTLMTNALTPNSSREGRPSLVHVCQFSLVIANHPGVMGVNPSG